VAGSYNSNDVYRCADALATSPTVSGSRGYKEIGVDDGADDQVIVRWAGNNVVGAKSGAASAFGISTDNGKTWNSPSLIDSELTTMMDVWVSPDGSVTYLLARDGDEISLYRKASAWQKVFCLANAQTDWIVRAADSDPDVVYLADRGATTMYYSTDGGVGKWTLRSSRYAVQDLAVQDEDVAYVARSSSNKVSKTTNGGFTWADEKSTRLYSGNIHTINLISDDNLLVGGDAGYVAYSSDGASSWERISKRLSGESATQVTATGLADGDFIFAGTDANDAIERWEIGTSTTWKDMAAPDEEGDYGTYGLVLNNDVLYAITSDGDTNSELQRTLELSTATPSDTKWAEVPGDGDFSRAPSALRASGSTVLWVINTAATPNELWALTDTVATGTAVELVAPADGFQNPVNPVSGNSQDIAFSWSKPTTGDVGYEIQIGLNEAMTEILTTHTVDATASATPVVLIGPNQQTDAGTQAVAFAAGQTYYWKVRVTKPFISPWSEVRSFTIQPLAAQVPTVLSPANGTDEAPPRPSFSWSPVAGASNYQFQLALNPYMNAPIVDVNIASTAYRLLAELERGTTYYWRVKATAPVAGDWSAVSNFFVAELEEPAPPIVVETLPAPIINIPEAPAPIQPADIVLPAPVTIPAPIAPPYIWAVIIIGAVLIIAVIILIVRTRRTI